ncbi:MAG: gamma carbonic anhydrase family protein [Holophagales bacterium]|jgi:carbonic anhydrase/acetyltransferase-like protein (isoleucine patch superfamily)|nr:gamma carbonic anhydrase family protein [Holophagales bacterium]
MIQAFQNMVPKIGQRVLVTPDAIVIGDVTVGDDSGIWFQCVIRGDVNWIEIGARVNIQDKCCLHVTNETWPLLIEDEVSVAHNVMLHGCTIRKGALVGMSSTVMDGAEIGEGCLVAAGSLVKEGFKAPPNTLVAGWPAVVKGEVNQTQKRITANIWPRYVGYKDLYVEEGWEYAPSNADTHEAPGFPRN